VERYVKSFTRSYSRGVSRTRWVDEGVSVRLAGMERNVNRDERGGDFGSDIHARAGSLSKEFAIVEVKTRAAGETTRVCKLENAGGGRLAGRREK